MAPIACGVLLMLAALAPVALASTNSPTGIEASLPANARTNPNVILSSVSCASAGNCTAVGSYLDGAGHSQGVLLSETSGSWAAGVEASLPANAGTNPSASAYSVSCASAGNCTAVGGYTDSSGHSQGLLLSETSGKWATGVQASLPANAGINPNVSLNSVSCASAGNCTAVGNYNDSLDSSTVQDQGLFLSETSGTWATGVDARLPAGAGTAQYAVVQDVACASAGNCTAGGLYEDNSFNNHGSLWTETSGTWAAGVDAPLPANAGTNPNAEVGSVSCTSAGNCTAVGVYDESSRGGPGQGLLLTETSGTWAAGVEASLPANAGTNPTAEVGSVSCTSAGNCTAVGEYDDSSGHSHGLLLTETSGTWAAGVEASLPANANTSSYNPLDAVSCASAGNCTAVGEYEDSSGHEQGLLLGGSAAVVPKPAVSKLSVSAHRFSAAGRKVHGKCVKLSKKNKGDKRCQLSIRLKATYTLNAAVKVRFRLALRTAGRKVGGKCVKASRKNKHHSKCTRAVSVHRTITRSGVAGSNKFSFTGKLASGTYQLTATPARGTSKTVTFKVTG